MEANTPQIIIALSGTVGGGLMLACLLCLRLTLTRRLKSNLEAHDEYWGNFTMDFGFFNTLVFAWACVIPSYTRWKTLSDTSTKTWMYDFSPIDLK